MIAARMLLGLSACVWGYVTLSWHDSELWQRFHALGVTGLVVGVVLSCAQIFGGITLLIRLQARVGALLVGTAFAGYALACVPAMVASPSDPGAYIDFFEQLSVACGALAFLRPRAARTVFGVCTISFAWAQAVYFSYTASLVPAWIPPSQSFWTTLTTIAFGAVAVAMLTDRSYALAARLTALMIALFGVIVWVPKIVAAPHASSNWSEISLNYAIAAAALLIAESRRQSRHGEA